MRIASKEIIDPYERSTFAAPEEDPPPLCNFLSKENEGRGKISCCNNLYNCSEGYRSNNPHRINFRRINKEFCLFLHVKSSIEDLWLSTTVEMYIVMLRTFWMVGTRV